MNLKPEYFMSEIILGNTEVIVAENLNPSIEVKKFCEGHGIQRYLQSAISLAKEYFPFIQELTLEVEGDPESNEEWVTIDITVEGNIEEIIENYDNYISKFISIIPWPEREKIILSYNII